MRFTHASKKMKHTLFSRTVQIACVKTHAILRTRPMQFYTCVIFDAIIRSEKRNASYLNLPVVWYSSCNYLHPATRTMTICKTVCA